MAEDPRPFPPEIERTFRSWRHQAAVLRACHVLLLTAASVFSILTAANVLRDTSAVLAAVSVGIISALDLGVKANGFRNAWRRMNAAMARYRSIPEFTVEQLIQAYEQAEALIGDLPSGPRPAVPETTGNVDQTRTGTSNRVTGPTSVDRFERV